MVWFLWHLLLGRLDNWIKIKRTKRLASNFFIKLLSRITSFDVKMFFLEDENFLLKEKQLNKTMNSDSFLQYFFFFSAAFVIILFFWNNFLFNVWLVVYPTPLVVEDDLLECVIYSFIFMSTIIITASF
jgi:hypothetical protein